MYAVSTKDVRTNTKKLKELLRAKKTVVWIDNSEVIGEISPPKSVVNWQEGYQEATDEEMIATSAIDCFGDECLSQEELDYYLSLPGKK